MTIHSEHPFLPPPEQRDVVRQLRGRLPAPVTIVATGSGTDRVGLTVSSILVVLGDPDRVVLMIDPDSDLGSRLEVGVRIAISVLTTGEGLLADTFAGLAPAPGGPFQTGQWNDCAFGPLREGASWLGAVVEDCRSLGWSQQVTARIDQAVLSDAPALIHQRGRYRT
ncbi:MAG: flavin reductase [Candidatus Nanopelagicales bacterium]